MSSSTLNKLKLHWLRMKNKGFRRMLIPYGTRWGFKLRTKLNWPRLKKYWNWLLKLISMRTTLIQFFQTKTVNRLYKSPRGKCSCFHSPTKLWWREKRQTCYTTKETALESHKITYQSKKEDRVSWQKLIQVQSYHKMNPK